MAACIARVFRIDPVSVLKATQDEWLVRVAAYEIVARLEEEARNPNKIHSDFEG